MSAARPAPAPLDVAAVRAQFPILDQEVHGKPLAYLDSAASAQRPEVVVEAMATYYRRDHANVHRGVHTLSQRATDAYEGARESVRRFLNAADAREVIFTRGTTEAINLVAASWGRANLVGGDEIVLTGMEHHSNIVPWQLIAKATGAVIRVVDFDDRGVLDLDSLARTIGPRTRLVAAVHVSNALGTVNPVREIVRLAHDQGVPVLLDGAQAVPHERVDVREIGCDFYAFSGHKVYGPTGIGALWGRAELLEGMPPWQGGGEMIRSVSFAGSTFAGIPARFEAGTPPIAAAVGLGVALDWLTALGLDAVAAHETRLLAELTERVCALPRVRAVGTAPRKAGVLSFVLEGIHPHDVGTVLDLEGVAVRTGHHCAQPVMERFRIPATTRASIGVYNTSADVDRLVAGLWRVIEVLG